MPASADPAARVLAPVKAQPALASGEVAALLAETLAERDVLFAASD